MKKLIAVILCMILICSTAVPALAAPAGDEMYDRLEFMAEYIRRYSLYSDDYDDPIKKALVKLFEEDPAFYDRFADSMFQAYDSYSHYIPPGSYETVYWTGEKYVGIGVTVTLEIDGIYVTAVFPGSPAEGAGVKPGDRITAVGGESVEGYDLDSITDAIRGPEGTEVGVSFERDGEIITVTLTRKPISMSDITFRDMGGGVAYIGIGHFSSISTFIDFVSVYDELPYQDFRSVIFDVRGNPGGSLDVLLNILNYVIPEKDKTMFAIKDRYGYELFKSNGLGWTPNKIIVLADETSASASEVFAGSLKDWKYAEVVGTATYGKGLGQYHLPNGDDSISVVSNFEIILPVTGSYDGVGIIPTYDVPLGKAPYELPVFFLMPAEKPLMAGSNSTIVRGLEQRLEHMGYFNGTPDNLFDDETLNAVNRFQMAYQSGYGLEVLQYCDTKTISAVSAEIDKLKNSFVYTDTQLEKAVELAAEAAAKPLSYKLPERDEPLSE